MMDAPPRAIMLDEAASMAHLKPEQLRKMIRKGHVPPTCVAYLGRWIRILADPFEAWLAGGGSRQHGGQETAADIG